MTKQRSAYVIALVAWSSLAGGSLATTSLTMIGCGSSTIDADSATVGGDAGAGGGADAASEGRDDGGDTDSGEPPIDPVSDSGASLSDGGAPKMMSPVARAFADPFVLHDGASYHLYATKSRGKIIPHITSTNLSSWNVAAENVSGAAPAISWP